MNASGPDAPQAPESRPARFEPRPAHARALRERLRARSFFIAPGAYDCITARLVQASGFPAAYVTGSGVSLSMLGAPDVGLPSYGEIRDRIAAMAEATGIALIADVDTGYGGPLNVMRTVRDLERAGVAALQIEDQAWPKKCGHEPGRRLVDVAEMTGRLRAAQDAREDADTIIIARTDAIAVEGLDAALARARAYEAAGADVIFVEAPPSREAMARIAGELSAPLLANMVEGGRTPLLPADELAALGFAFAIYPNALTRMIARMGMDLLASLASTGATTQWRDRMLDHDALWALFESGAWYALERRYLER
jgi:2-methylisocitrate lyase-like PEP mutase family enzyme